MLIKHRKTVVEAFPNIQKCVRLSSTIVEYVLLTKAIKTVVLSRSLITELSIEQISPRTFSIT